MNVLIKVVSRSIVGLLTLGMLGCGCLFPYTPNTLSNLYVKLYSEADSLLRAGKYRAAIEKYEQAFKIRPRSADIIDARFPALFKYRIAFCYAKLGEAERDISLYAKAEAAVRESYQTTTIPYYRAHILYLWGYILFKQERYGEARAKFEAVNLPDEFLDWGRRRLMWDGLYALGKTYQGLDDKAAARGAFKQLDSRINTFLQDGGWFNSVGDGIVYALGKRYLELGDETAARRIFTKLEGIIKTYLQKGWPYVETNILYGLGKARLELGDEAAARLAFTQLLKHYPNTSYKTEVERLLDKR